jgi:hypothetical protein
VEQRNAEHTCPAYRIPTIESSVEQRNAEHTCCFEFFNTMYLHIAKSHVVDEFFHPLALGAMSNSNENAFAG